MADEDFAPFDVNTRMIGKLLKLTLHHLVEDFAGVNFESILERGDRVHASLNLGRDGVQGNDNEDGLGREPFHTGFMEIGQCVLGDDLLLTIVKVLENIELQRSRTMCEMKQLLARDSRMIYQVVVTIDLDAVVARFRDVPAFPGVLLNIHQFVYQPLNLVGLFGNPLANYRFFNLFS